MPPTTLNSEEPVNVSAPVFRINLRCENRLSKKLRAYLPRAFFNF